MASTAVNLRMMEGIVTPRSESSNGSPNLANQQISAELLASYTATLAEFAASRNNICTIQNDDMSTTEDEEMYDDQNSQCFKTSVASPTDSAKKSRKQSKPNKIEESSENSSVAGEEPENFEKCSEQPMETEGSPNDNIHLYKTNMPDELLRCSHCSFTAGNHEQLKFHIIEVHLGKMLINKNESTQQFEQQNPKPSEAINLQQQAYHRRLFAETFKIRNNLCQTNQSDNTTSAPQLSPIQQDTINKFTSDDNLNRDDSGLEEGEVCKRTENEMLPLNLSNPRWNEVTKTLSQNLDTQKNLGTSLPASIPMPQSFPGNRLNLPGFFPFGHPPFLFPFMQQNERENMLNSSNPQGSIGSGQSRIFNTEAFCDLCNKEFCNKYFLKTHKANKHAIYTDEPASTSPIPMTPTTPLGSSIPFSHSTPLMSTPLVHTPLTPSSMSFNSPYAGAFYSTTLNNLVLPPPLVPPHLGNHKMSSSIKQDSALNKGGVINIEAYCELCQKEFCNKYFLKRHKLKIHNVNIEVTIKNTKNIPVLDRPEGWCDACRRDIGSKQNLNSHKMSAHGPHVVNNITSHIDSVRSPPDFRNVNPNAMLPGLGNMKNDQIPRDNFSPWDISRQKSPFGNSFNLKSPNKPLEMRFMFENDKRLPNNAPPIEQQIRFLDQMNKIDVINRMAHINSFKLNPNSATSPPNVTNTTDESVKPQVKLETNEMDTSYNVSNEAGKDISMPILKPQNESLNKESKPTSLEDMPPALSREHPLTLNEKFLNDHSANINKPPVTPGSVSNSTDDSSREAGFIARVGQPAITSAPPGTKFTNEQLRQFGVVNPEAFCELCCKEFCNKYFLRTHRWKKHGIYTPEYSDRSKQQFKDNIPLDISKIFERQASDFKNFNDSENAFKLRCNICQISLPNSHLLYMHKMYYHNNNAGLINLPFREQLDAKENLRRIALQVQRQKIQDQQNMMQQQKLNEFQQQMESNKIHNNNNEASIYVRNMNDSIEMDEMRNQQRIELADMKDAQMQQTDSKSTEDIHTFNTLTDSKMNDSLSIPTSGYNASISEADTSQDLRKLQSMILGLNRKDDDIVQCKICHKTVGNSYLLKAHMASDHHILFPEANMNENQHIPELLYEANQNNYTPVSMDRQSYCCDICKKSCVSRIVLQQHMITEHGMQTPQGPTSFLDRIRAEVEGKEDRKPQSVMRGFCEICNKELCNKYFMKTHMLKMHGLNIENSEGASCDLCNKDLLNKCLLKIHRQNSHGLIEEMNDVKDMDILDSNAFPILKDLILMRSSEPITGEECTLCQRKFRNIKWLKIHLIQDHGEEGKQKWREIEPTVNTLDLLSQINQSCNICGEEQEDLVALQLHIIKHHNSENIDVSAGEGNQSFNCSLCSFVCDDITMLNVHEKSHYPEVNTTEIETVSSLHCAICPTRFTNSLEYRNHLMKHKIQGLIDSCHNPNINNSSQKTLRSKRTIWKCRKCNKKFKTRISCLVHSFRKHSVKNRPIYVNRIFPKRNKYTCNKCHKSSPNLGALLTHIRDKSCIIETNKDNTSDRSISQCFSIDSIEKDVGKIFLPTIANLRVSERVTYPLKVTFTLTPSAQN